MCELKVRRGGCDNVKPERLKKTMNDFSGSSEMQGFKGAVRKGNGGGRQYDG